MLPVEEVIQEERGDVFLGGRGHETALMENSSPIDHILTCQGCQVSRFVDLQHHGLHEQRRQHESQKELNATISETCRRRLRLGKEIFFLLSWQTLSRAKDNKHDISE